MYVFRAFCSRYLWRAARYAPLAATKSNQVRDVAAPRHLIWHRPKCSLGVHFLRSGGRVGRGAAAAAAANGAPVALEALRCAETHYLQLCSFALSCFALQRTRPELIKSGESGAAAANSPETWARAASGANANN